jgi:hypothetical protein
MLSIEMWLASYGVSPLPVFDEVLPGLEVSLAGARALVGDNMYLTRFECS